MVHSVIVALGCTPGLGVVHTGHERSFVYDIADLYKAETSIPVAFDVVAHGLADVGAGVRRAMREAMFAGGLLERCVRDISTLLLGEADAGVDEIGGADVVLLWDETRAAVAGGTAYAESPEPESGPDW